MFSFKINKLSTTDNILNGKPCDHSILECYNLFSGVELSMRSFFVIYAGYLNKDISFGGIVYFEPKNVQYKKLANGTIDRLIVLLVNGDGNEILSNFKISIVLHII